MNTSKVQINPMETTRFLIVLTLIAISNSPCLAADKYALIVGVSSYRPEQPLPPLSYTENDANGLAEVLKAGGYNVTLMTQAVGRIQGKEVLAPHSDFIRDQISAILDSPFLKDDDLVVVAMAGHGVQYEFRDDQQNKTTKFYFCPMDADIRKLKTANDVTDRNHLIDLDELYTALKNSKAGGKLLLVDACRNDPTKPSLSRMVTSATLPPLPPPPGGTAAFFSCSAEQRAFEDIDLQHGVFFHQVIQALRGDADTKTAKRPADGEITLAELSEHVSKNTYDYVRAKFQGAKQSPELKGEFRVSIPLITLSAPAIPELSDKQLNQYLLAALAHDFEIREKYVKSENANKQLRMQFELVYEFYRSVSAFGMEYDLEPLREMLYGLLSNINTAYHSEPKDLDIERIRDELDDWLIWDEVPANVREQIVTMLSEKSLSNLKQLESERENARDAALLNYRQDVLISLKNVVGPDVYEGLVRRAIRERYWNISMNAQLNVKQLPILDLKAVLECDGIDARSLQLVPNDRPLVVQISAVTWCGPCKATLNHWVKIQEEFGDSVALLWVSYDDNIEEAKTILAEHKVRAIVVGSNRSKFPSKPAAFNGMPRGLLCDSSGKFVSPLSEDDDSNLAPRSDEIREKLASILREHLGRPTKQRQLDPDA